jgi:hypothetical protein
MRTQFMTVTTQAVTGKPIIINTDLLVSIEQDHFGYFEYTFVNGQKIVAIENIFEEVP